MTLRHIVVGVDGSLTSVRALDWAAAEAVRHGGALRVLYAVPDRDEATPVLAYAASRTRERRHITPELPSLTAVHSPGQERMARESRAEEAVAHYALTHLRDQHRGVVVESHAVRTAPAPALLTASQEAAVVVVGAHRRTGVFGPRLGPVAHTLLHRSHCP